MDAPTSPPYRGAQTTMMVISIIFTVFGSMLLVLPQLPMLTITTGIAIVLRLVGRWVVLRKFGVDDITMVAGMVCLDRTVQ